MNNAQSHLHHFSSLLHAPKLTIHRVRISARSASYVKLSVCDFLGTVDLLTKQVRWSWRLFKELRSSPITWSNYELSVNFPQKSITLFITLGPSTALYFLSPY
jgi:hypothetical protein